MLSHGRMGQYVIGLFLLLSVFFGSVPSALAVTVNCPGGGAQGATRVSYDVFTAPTSSTPGSHNYEWEKCSGGEWVGISAPAGYIRPSASCTVKSGGTALPYDGSSIFTIPASASGSYDVYHTNGWCRTFTVNNPPVANSRQITTNEDTQASVAASWSDTENNGPFVAAIVTGPSAGVATASGTTLTYLPAANWSGTTSFTYRVCDGGGVCSGPATVTVTVNPVNDAPIASARSLVTSEDTQGGVSASWTDVENNGPFSVQIVSAPGVGTATVSGNNLYYNPPANWAGTTSFTYRVCDGANLCSTATIVNVTVNQANDSPVAQPRSISTNEDTQGSVGAVWADVENNGPFTLKIVSAPSVGVASVSGTTVVYTPAKDWYGQTGFTYQVCDGAMACSSPAAVSVSVISVNDPPVATVLSISTRQNVSASVQALWTDAENNGQFLVEITANSEHGTASVVGSSLQFSPEQDWSGVTSFDYRVIDGSGAASAPVTVTVDVGQSWSAWMDAGECVDGRKSQLRMCPVAGGCVGSVIRTVACSAPTACPSL